MSQALLGPSHILKHALLLLKLARQNSKASAGQSLRALLASFGPTILDPRSNILQYKIGEGFGGVNSKAS